MLRAPPQLYAQRVARPLSLSEPPEPAPRPAAVTAWAALLWLPTSTQQLQHTQALSGHTIPRTRGNRGAPGTSAQLGQQIPALGHLCALQSCQGLEVSRMPSPPLAPPPTWDDHPVPCPVEEFPGPSPASAAGKQEGLIAACRRQGAASGQGRGQVCIERRRPSSPEELTAISRRAGASLLMEARSNHLPVAGDGTCSTRSRIHFQASPAPLPHRCLPRACSSPTRHQWLGADALRNGWWRQGRAAGRRGKQGPLPCDC